MTMPMMMLTASHKPSCGLIGASRSSLTAIPVAPSSAALQSQNLPQAAAPLQPKKPPLLPAQDSQQIREIVGPQSAAALAVESLPAWVIGQRGQIFRPPRHHQPLRRSFARFHFFVGREVVARNTD